MGGQLPPTLHFFQVIDAIGLLCFDCAQGLEHLIVHALFCHELLVIAGLDYIAVLKDNDAIRAGDSGQPVRNDDHGAPF